MSSRGLSTPYPSRPLPVAMADMKYRIITTIVAIALLAVAVIVNSDKESNSAPSNTQPASDSPSFKGLGQ